MLKHELKPLLLLQAVAVATLSSNAVMILVGSWLQSYIAP
jgi:hypothetical protein